MPHIVNPAGRILEIDDLQEFTHWLSEPGFKQATEQEIIEYTTRRRILLERMKENADEGYDPNKAIYMATVTPGGKDGYGISSQHLIDELLTLNAKVSGFQKGQKLGFLFHSPYALLRLENPFRIIYTMFESDKIPDDWKEYLETADKVLVPSQWCAEVFAKAGVNTEVVPLGYNDHVFTYQDRPEKEQGKDTFYFLHYNAFNLRKGFVEVFKAFTKAFDPLEPVKMIFKTTLNDLPAGFNFVPSQYPNIEIQKGGVTDVELAALCGKADCFVFPSRGEGFGITPLEAMATGLPTIVPNAHGITEYFNTEYMYEVKVKEKCPGIYSRYKNQDVGEMVICDVDDLAAQMRYVYEHRNEAMEKGRKASNYVKQWTFSRTAARLKELFDEYLAKEIDPKRLQNILVVEEVI